MSTAKTNSALSNPQFDCVVQLERLSDSFVAEMTAHRPSLQPQQAKKMSTPKTNSALSNPQFDCVVQLERLSDSIVAEMTARRPALQPQQAKKMSTSKPNSYLSNPQFVCVVQLDRLSDSVVAEMTARRSAFPPQNMESIDDALNINCLPAEMLINIFSHLPQNELGKMARVCRRWNELTKSPVLWKKVNVELHNSLESQTTSAKCFVNRLPSCVTAIRLQYWDVDDCTERLNFEELCVTLQKRCPHLETLILQSVHLSDNLPSVIGLCNEFLPDLKILIFDHCIFADCSTREEFGGTSKIEVLGVSSCYLTLRHFKPPFSRMPNLKKLSLYDTFGTYSWFQEESSFFNQLHVFNLGGTGIGFREFKEVFNHGLNLRELYVCSTLLSEDFNFLLLFVINSDLNFNNSVFPHLKTVCLGGIQHATCKDVVSLIQSCQSLQNVYVMRHVALRYAAHPFVVANKCKLEIVKSTFDCNDHQIINRLCD